MDELVILRPDCRLADPRLVESNGDRAAAADSSGACSTLELNPINSLRTREWDLIS
jgi:hypothetical protein